MKRNVTFLLIMALLLIPAITVINFSYAAGDVKVQMYNSNTAATTNSIYPKIKLISGSSVVITCASALPVSGVKAGYAFTTGGTKRTNGTVRWGLLRDSDPFRGSTTGIAQPNFCVAFELDVP